MAISKDSPKDPLKIKRIMKNALLIFAQEGYRDTKTDKIAQAAEVSKGTLFRYYQNKANLYLATLRYAMDRVDKAADYSVWTGADDLVEMIIRATKYKIELQLAYPTEFKLLLHAYGAPSSLPAQLRAETQQIYAQNTQKTFETLITPVLQKMPLRKDIPLPLIRKAITALVDLVQQEAQDFIRKHPDAAISDLEEIIMHAQSYMNILQDGFSAPE
ncbi:TetR/AcrR family transcriptional regulator [Liquorilactobacillus capillatus]|nr:TetR/AcrR family transcriptional regulator [Liquorilactobacillus capillatus]